MSVEVHFTCLIWSCVCGLPLPHDVAVEGVEDTLVGQLQGVVQHHHAVRLLDLRRVAGVLRLGQFLLPHLRRKVLW